MIYTEAPWITKKNKYDMPVIYCASGGKGWAKFLSPFIAGPVKLWGDHWAYNVENAWQYSKVYECHLEDFDGWLKWAKEGWDNIWAKRYPMGKGVKPEFHYWDGEALDYIEARKRIYIPLFERAMRGSEAFAELKKLYEEGDILLTDPDVYDREDKSWKEIIEDPNKIMGHSFVLAMMLEGYI